MAKRFEPVHRETILETMYCSARAVWAAQKERGDKVAKKKIFVSFDFDNDKTLKDFFIAQAKLPDSPFDVIDGSLKEAAPQANWEQSAMQKIYAADIVVVMVGPYTHRASGVLKEVKFANHFQKPIFQINGYKDGNPTPVENAGRFYAWNWNNLKTLLA
jgi:hypothetical protein